MSNNIKDYPQWMLWRFEGLYPDQRKIPVNQWGDRSGSTHTHDYVAYETAFAASERLVVQGPAFRFTQDPFVGIDLDNCVKPSGAFENWCCPIVAQFAHCYMEESPSRTGVKIWTQGKIPVGYGSRVACGDGQIEVYEHGRYFAYTGLGLSATDQSPPSQEQIDWLFQTYFRRLEANPVATALPVSSTARRSDLDRVEQRIRDYVDNCERPQQGGRNNAAFSIAGHLYSIVEEGGQVPTDDQVLQGVLRWNQPLPDPLSESEVRQVVGSAARNGTPRDAKPPEQREEMLPGLDVSKIVVPKPDTNLHPVVPEPMQVEVVLPSPPVPQHTIQIVQPQDNLSSPTNLEIPGFIGELAKYTCRTAIYAQPELAIAGAISLLGLLTGRKVKDNIFGTRTNTYSLGIAPTGGGKEHARKVNKQLLQEIGASSMCGPERIGSAAGVVSHVKGSPAILFSWMSLGG